jgi:hypothetical protein
MASRDVEALLDASDSDDEPYNSHSNFGVSLEAILQDDSDGSDFAGGHLAKGCLSNPVCCSQLLLMLFVCCIMHVLSMEHALQIHLHECAVLLHAAAILKALQALHLLQDLPRP